MSRHDEVPLHRSYAIAWSVWIAWLLGVTFLPLGVWWSRAMFVAFFLLEVVGHLRENHGLGDTLSETMQHIAAWGRKDGHVPKWWKSWPWLAVTVLLGLVTYQAVWVSSYWREPWDNPVRGAIVGVGIFGWNWWHWVRRERYG